MKISILFGAALGFVVGVAALARATEPCEPTTRLTLEKITKNGVEVALPTDVTTDIASASSSYVFEELYDPTTGQYVSVRHQP